MHVLLTVNQVTCAVEHHRERSSLSVMQADLIRSTIKLVVVKVCLRKHESWGKPLGKWWGTSAISSFEINFPFFNISVHNLQVSGLQSKRSQELQRLRDLVYHVENDNSITLGTSWKAYLKGGLDWANGDGQKASFSDIERRYKDVQEQVHYIIFSYEFIMTMFDWFMWSGGYRPLIW